MTHVKIYISCIIINQGKNTFELVGTVFNCQYSETKLMLMLGRRAKGHFVKLVEIHKHLITCISGHIWFSLLCRINVKVDC